MKRILLAGSLLAAACSPQDATLPGMPEIDPGAETASSPITLVGPGTISTDAMEFAFTLSPDGQTAYFNRVDENRHIAIWTSKRDPETGEWGKSATLAFTDPRYADIDPFLSRDGSRLYFSSDRPMPGAADDAPTPDTNTWVSIADETGMWQAPVFAGETINSAQDETFVSLDEAGDIYFARFGEGEGRDRPTTIMMAAPDGEGFAEPAALGTEPDDLRLSNPAISADGTLLVAAAANGGAPGLWYSRKLDDGWRAFTKLPLLPGSEDGVFAPYLDADDVLYFTMDRDGQRDIYSIPFGEIGLD